MMTSESEVTAMLLAYRLATLAITASTSTALTVFAGDDRSESCHQT